MLEVYGIRNCDSVKKVRKLLEAESIGYTFHDFDTESPDEALIDTWIEGGATPEELFNGKSITSRQLGLKAKELSDAEKKTWLVRENRLIKRPVVVLPTGETLVGAANVTKHLISKEGN